jgi:hypothetical protein
VKEEMPPSKKVMLQRKELKSQRDRTEEEVEVRLEKDNSDLFNNLI